MSTKETKHTPCEPQSAQQYVAAYEDFSEDDDEGDSMQTYLSSAGNHVKVARIVNGHVFMCRLGYFDCAAEYHAIKPESWANFAEPIFRGLVADGALAPAVMMIGDYPMREAEFIDGTMWRMEK